MSHVTVFPGHLGAPKLEPWEHALPAPTPPPRPAIDLTAACALLGGARGAPLTPTAAALSVFPAPASWGAPLLHLPTVLVAFSGVKWPLTVVLICMMASDVERLAR